METLPIQESAATITGLQPETFYVVRVSLVNNMEFSSKSAPLRFRTKHSASRDFFVLTADGHDTDNDGTQEPVPRVRPFRALKSILPASPETVPMAREGSTGLMPRRSVTGRRSSPALHDPERHAASAEESEPFESAETITELTEKLNAIRQETDEAEKQAKEEEEEETRLKEDLVKERDELKAEAMEKEKASRNLKREVNTLERQNTTAQNERTKHERILAQKKQDRQKLKEDMVRWEREAESMKEDVTRIQQEKAEYLDTIEKDKDDLRAKQAEESTAIKNLDDEVREKSTEIKKLERIMKNNSPNGSEPEPNLVQQLQQDAEERRQWDIQYQAMQQQYAITAQKLEQAKRFCAEQQAYLESLRARRRQEEAAHYASPPATQERPLRRGDSQRSRRAQSGNSSSDSPGIMNAFPHTSAPFAPGATSTTSIFPGMPFLNVMNGMTMGGPTDDLVLSEDEREKLTGGALMSPGAGADLLPADLFGEGDSRASSDFIRPLPGLGALPGLGGLPGPATRPDDLGPASPASGSSKSPSVFASPQASQQNLAYIGSPENIIDADRRSIRSNRSTRATSGSGAGSRFSGMFGIKQRAKTQSTDDGLALGKASSMPRQDGGIPGLDSNTRKRNSSVSGSVFSGFSGDGGFDAPPIPATRRSRFNIFSKAPAEGSGWPTTFSAFGRRPASPRPGSTHSNELPRPSMDSSRWGVDAWPSGDTGSGARSSPLAFGSAWNAPASQQSRIFGSRHPSRRPSAQYGVSGPPDDIMEDSDDSDDSGSYRAANLGPIGSRPPGSKKAEKAPMTDAQRLNPAAKDFKSFFSGMSLTKSKDKSREKDNASTVASSASGTPNLAQGDFGDDLSPPHSRRSKDTRDARSFTTNESSIAESGRNSTELARTPSYTNSEAAAPSPLLSGTSAGKESFMQKLSRKSSSGKFTLPTFKREKSRLDTHIPTPTSVPAEEAEYEDGSLSASFSSEKFGRDSMSKEQPQRNSSGRNWSNVLKLGMGKKGDQTPSVSGLSITSGAEDGDDEELASGTK